ncbi:hypothetical protein, partial [Desulfosarcina sp.]|uniref:hypothetical protein n=1 Tax=Desulfosarcina sp. TaxID=2027861 RepID=UPI003566C9C4
RMRCQNISSMGLVTNVGRDVRTACGSLRAGLVRLEPLPDFVAYDPDTLEAPILGAPVSGVMDGFAGSGRFVRLAQLAIADLLAYGDLPGRNDTAFWSSTGFAWCLPEISYERFMWPEDEIPKILEIAFGGRVLSGLNLSSATTPFYFTTGGHTGVAQFLSRIDALFDKTNLSRIILIATDSLLDVLSLQSLIEQDRIKTGARPTGLYPGEASAAVLLEPSSKANSSSRNTEARLLSTALRPAPNDIDKSANPKTARVEMAAKTGRNLEMAVKDALANAGVNNFKGDLIVDLNGEQWRALAWGHAQVQLTSWMDFDQIRLITPCASLGEIGAASPLVAVCLATQAFVKGYALGDCCVIASVSDRMDASAIVIRPPAYE